MTTRLLHGDCLEAMRAMEANSVDAVVTDPPYGLEFMGKEWDRLSADPNIGKARAVGFDTPDGKPDQREQNKGGTWFGSRSTQAPNYYRTTNAKCRNCGKWRVSGGHDGKGNTLGCQCATPDFPNVKAEAARAMQAWHEAWATEALRVLKPGGYLLAAGGSRTYHRLACGIEDVGFIVKDSIDWIAGSGFPKSHAFWQESDPDNPPNGRRVKPGFEQWQGWGTALKPAKETFVVAQKPLDGTYAANVARWGVGGLNIDGCRIDATDGVPQFVKRGDASANAFGNGLNGSNRTGEIDAATGRWPANLILSHSDGCRLVGTKRVKSHNPDNKQPTGANAFDGGWTARSLVGHADPDGLELVEAWECAENCAVAALDAQAGDRPGGYRANASTPDVTDAVTFKLGATRGERGYADSGGPSRFFLTVAHTDDDGPLGFTPDPKTWQGMCRCLFYNYRDVHVPGCPVGDALLTVAPDLPIEHLGFPAKYVAKASRAERNAGLEGLPPVATSGAYGTETVEGAASRGRKPRHQAGKEAASRVTAYNSHPTRTVKPLALMRWLVRLVTPPGGVCLDPFAGSGTTLVAAIHEGFNAIGIEQSAEYVAICEARIAHAEAGGETKPAKGVGRSQVYNHATDRKVQVCPACDRRWHSGAKQCEKCGGPLEWRSEQAERDRKPERPRNLPLFAEVAK